MLLTIDIGNTNIVAGVFVRAELLALWRIETDRHRMPDEYAVLLDSLLRLQALSRDALDGAIICSVVPSVQESICAAIKRYMHLEPIIVSPELDTGLPVQYSPPEAVGPDRIANAVAAIAEYGAPAIVVDFGTATTVDAVSREGKYIGGAIAPGLEISTDALFSRTARLRPVPLESPSSPIGQDTTASLQSGILYGYAGLVDGLVGRFQTVLGTDAPVIGTGGLARTIVPHTRTVQDTRPDLTLLGLRLLYERNARRAHPSRPSEDQSLTGDRREAPRRLS